MFRALAWLLDLTPQSEEPSSCSSEDDSGHGPASTVSSRSPTDAGDAEAGGGSPHPGYALTVCRSPPPVPPREGLLMYLRQQPKAAAEHRVHAYLETVSPRDASSPPTLPSPREMSGGDEGEYVKGLRRRFAALMAEGGEEG